MNVHPPYPAATGQGEDKGKGATKSTRANPMRRPNVQTVKESVPAREFYRVELPLMTTTNMGGWRDGGLCPFHSDHHAGSFKVHLNDGAYNCFSCGAKGGDIVAFTMERYALSFTEALRKLADDWRV